MKIYPSLLLTKIQIPKGRPSQVARPHLTAVLDKGLDGKLNLIAAAAGFGKTTLAAAWCAKYSGQVAWVSLDESDNDPIRFLSYLVAAVQQPYPEFGQELLASLQAPQPPTLENALYSLVNQLAVLENRLILALDDYHVIEKTAIHDALTFLLNHLPSQTTLLLLSRSDPPLPLARLRARNELIELRAAHLRFSEKEAADFLNQSMALGLTDQAVQSLESRTEGWIAGLQLAAIALQNNPAGREGFIEAFTGSHHFVLEYLIEEVLTNQPPKVRDFLVKTAFLQRVCASLCDAVIEQDGQSQTMIDYLEKHNLFIIPLDYDRVWYRYHHLFADLLQARSLDQIEDEIPHMQRRAAEWHEANNLPEEAVRYALEAKAFRYAVHLITGPAASVFQRGEVNTLLSWFQALPSEYLDGNPSLSLQFGLAFALNGRWPEAERLLDQVEQVKSAEIETADLVLLSFLVASHRQDIAALQAIIEKAAQDPHPHPLTKTVLALIYFLLGQNDRAAQLLAEAQVEADRQEEWAAAYHALLQRCRIHIYLGHLHQARDLCLTALERSKKIDRGAFSQTSLAYSVLGRIHIEWDELDTAADYLNQAIETSEKSGFRTGMLSSNTIMLAEVYDARGDHKAVESTAEQALTYAARHDPPAEVEWLKTYQARMWLNEGNLSAAVDWLERLESMEQERPLPVSIFYPSQIRPVTKARILLGQRKTAEAIEILTALTAAPPTLLTVEAHALLALARQANGDSVNAQNSLEQTLALAEPENRIRLFLNMGRRPMYNLLETFCSQKPKDHPLRPFGLTLLERFPDEAELTPLIEPLSDRELEVLELIIAGHSNKEIADSLVLALSTVKWYINTIYGKLQVKSRSQAIAKAHELGIFLTR